MKYLYLFVFLFFCFFIPLHSQNLEYHKYMNAYYARGISDSFDAENILMQNLIRSANDAESKLAVKAQSSNAVFLRYEKLSAPDINYVKILYAEMTTFAQSKGYDNLSPFFLNSMGEIGFRLLSFLPLNELIKVSSDTKKYFETALKKEKNNFAANLNLGQWYYFSPAVAGGSLRKALQYYNEAEKYASEAYQKHIVAVWRAQVHLKSRDTKKYDLDMQKAKSIFPNGAFYEYVVKKNMQIGAM